MLEKCSECRDWFDKLYEVDRQLVCPSCLPVVIEKEVIRTVQQEVKKKTRLEAFVQDILLSIIENCGDIHDYIDEQKDDFLNTCNFDDDGEAIDRAYQEYRDKKMEHELGGF